MSEAYKKLIKALETIFEMDKADLDFGIYRIMNQRRGEIKQFLENNLLSQVGDAFKAGELVELKKELKKAITLAKEYNPNTNPEEIEPVKELRKKIASSADITAMENDVYSHLHTFFSRYYDKGDFISQRRYKSDVYAIPYGGEEVKLYWANQDQYYIKSSEYLRDYAFTLQQNGDKKRVHFHVVEADIEKDNVKARIGEERRIVLDSDNPLAIVDGELTISFHYVQKGREKQGKLNSDAVKTIFEQKGFDEWLVMLKQKPTTAKNQNRTFLEKYLNDYTARYTFDYFIHKDLGGFLCRELDFYIKNEIFRLDDIDKATFVVTEQHLRKIKVIRSIAHKLIRMLAQLEDFQKKLWLKKKFVVETNYCITLDRVPIELYGEIVSCSGQHLEWMGLGFTADDTKITESYLKKNPYLVLDTKFFGDEFKSNLLASIESFDEQCDGLLIHSDNYQALNQLQNRYKDKIKCIYVDPPYNTSDNAFLYKNTYKHSSWLSMMANRVSIASTLMQLSGIFLGAIDDTEYSSFKSLLIDVFGGNNYVGTIAVEVNPAGQNIRPNVPARSHDYFHIFSKDIERIHLIQRSLTQGELKQYKEKDANGRFYWDNLRRRGGNSRPTDRPKQWFPLYIKENNVRVPDMEWDDLSKLWSPNEVPHFDETKVWPIDPKGEKRIWRFNPDGVRREIANSEISVIKKAKRFEISKKSREPNGKKPKTLWPDSKYSATTNGSKLVRDILGPGLHFSYPKSIYLTLDAIRSWADESATVLDFFAGSGTTGHAVINLNREDNGKRKYILIEMDSYFYSVLKPRIEKIIYSADWNYGKPTGSKTGSSHCFKYIRLESYEDALNNLIFTDRTKQQQNLLESNKGLLEDYMLGYWLDVETRDSGSLLNVEQFKDPFNYMLKIATANVGATKRTRVDLVETFNYLLGLTIQHIDTVCSFKVITGTNPKDESVLVVWRNVKEQNNAVLEEFFDKSGYNLGDTEYNHIYVNGDHSLDDPYSKVKIIEIEFKRLMFDMHNE